MTSKSLETGDLLLFAGSTWLSRVLEFFGHCQYSHVAVVVRDPENMQPGLYVVQSGTTGLPDAITGRVRFGVQIELFDTIASTYQGTIFWRRPSVVTSNLQRRLMLAFLDVHQAPYDTNLNDWLCAKMHQEWPNFPMPSVCRQVTSRFWCSAFACYLYCKAGVVPTTINWTLVTPADFDGNGIFDTGTFGARHLVTALQNT